mmetsp:Transcript_13520/g.15142  ORF Transcript_13520/g.15142 Transcript_13520/m.15142 type:complete len:119 (+) Transcript_13520:313-669(+)
MDAFGIVVGLSFCGYKRSLSVLATVTASYLGISVSTTQSTIISGTIGVGAVWKMSVVFNGILWVLYRLFCWGGVLLYYRSDQCRNHGLLFLYSPSSVINYNLEQFNMTRTHTRTNTGE